MANFSNNFSFNRLALAFTICSFTPVIAFPLQNYNVQIDVNFPGKMQVGTFLMTTGIKYATDSIIEIAEQKKQRKGMNNRSIYTHYPNEF